MADDRAWTINGISDQTRAAARQAAQAAGRSIGEWIDQALATAAEEARHPQPPAVTRAEVTGAVREALSEQLTAIAESIDQLTERLASLEETVGRRPRPELTSEAAGAPSPIGAVRERLCRRRGL